jgi:16S rRNA (uracil1498-N3)-methyltransferase
LGTQVFVSEHCAAGVLVSLDPADLQHLRAVLRLQPGDALTVISQGKPWRAQVHTLEHDRILAKILEPAVHRGDLPAEIIVLQAIPKGNKMDEVIEKVTELGAARIVPIRCERSYGGDSNAKVARWRRIARAAAAQSQRLVIPQVDESSGLREALERFSKTAQLLVAWEQAPLSSLASALSRSGGPDALAIAVGPEGSFTEPELDAADRLHAARVSLGPTTLRTETAAAAAIAAIAALRGYW